ncbi:cytochrome c oxidase accessory protein CcoG [Zoogloea sp.]|uniref:cytochrome c oxidase accessory protein CcoG n=1 Tax=Zoogloea sp. TaxID=49181 RepID=UPI0035B06B6B
MRSRASSAAVIPIEPQPLVKAEPKVYPRWVSGLFQRWRWFFVALTQLVFYGLCWIPWNGRQAVLFDLEARRFYLFDLVLWPQDTVYLALLLVLSALALFLVTAVAGRLWCGYTCPQTVYTEIFLWLEKLFEGDRPQRVKLDSGPWTAQKLARKAVKHGAWATISLWTGLTFVGYFTPIRELVQGVITLSLGGWETFWILFYGAATYGNAGFLREQMCKYICPYARFQFVMFDPDTLIIAYDQMRGDPRGSRSRKTDSRAAGLGDCVDCGICVQVCPTGIDIRNGLQNECIGCAACIDACDQVMDKMGYAPGLIRYSTENAVREGFSRADILKRAFRPRILTYSAVFLTLVTATAWSLATRVPLKADFARDRAALAREVDDGAIENVFRVQVTNASEEPRTYTVSVEGAPGIHLAGGDRVDVAAAAIGSETLSVRVPAEALAPGAHPIRFHVRDVTDSRIAVDEDAKFWMPGG